MSEQSNNTCPLEGCSEQSIVKKQLAKKVSDEFECITCPLAGCNYDTLGHSIGVFNHLVYHSNPHHSLDYRNATKIYQEWLMNHKKVNKALGSSTLQPGSNAKQTSPPPSEQKSGTISREERRRSAQTQESETISREERRKSAQSQNKGGNEEKNNVEKDTESVTSTVNHPSPIKRKNTESPIITPVKKVNLQESSSEAEDEATTDVTPIKRKSIAALEIESPLKRLNIEEEVPKITWGNFKIPRLSTSTMRNKTDKTSKRSTSKNESNKKKANSKETSKNRPLFSEPKRYKCDLCDKSYLQPLYLNRHISTFHTETYQSCDECSEVFLNAQLLLTHVKKTHTAEDVTCKRDSARLHKDNTYSKYGHHSGLLYLPAVKKLLIDRNLRFVCDQPTEAFGNCFPYSIMQQLNRAEILRTLSDNIRMLSENYYDLRKAIVQFVTNIAPTSEYYGLIDESRVAYNDAVGGYRDDAPDWNGRLKEMGTSRTWFDDQFMQFTAWFLKRDIICYIKNMNMKFCGSSTGRTGYFNASRPCNCGVEPLHIANIDNVHYQSLLPLHVPQPRGNRDKNNVEKNKDHSTQCDSSTPQQANLKRHSESQHSVKDNLPLSNIRDSKKEHYKNKAQLKATSENKPTETNRSCDECPEVFLSTQLLIAHVKKTHIAEDVTCPICDKSFQREQEVTTHMNDVHNIDNEGNRNTTKNLPILACNQCDYTTPKPSILKRHVDYKHYDNKKVVSQDPKKSRMLPKVESSHHSPDEQIEVVEIDCSPICKSFVCPICDLSFQLCDTLKLHQRKWGHFIRDVSPNFVAKFNCPLCDLGFENIKQLEEHISSTKSTSNSITCDKCCAIFQTHEQKNSHLNNVAQ